MTALSQRNLMLHDNTGRPLWSPNEQGCWIWQLSRLGSGYGQYRGTTAHRWIYQHFKGPLPTCLQLDHLCRTRSCVNPEHLEPITPTENIRRRPVTKLSVAQIVEIRALVKSISLKEIALRFNVSASSISLIANNVIWHGIGEIQPTLDRRGWVAKKLTAAKVRAARRLREQGASLEDVADRFQISRATAFRVTRRLP
jgi:transposase